ncbi:MAG TPA: AIM24 family protein [Acidobacteriaceae bacterium]|nr:AIM24 family protein [Acidobacteriaceae bacterium]
MFCTNCGSPLQPGVNFCTSCGSRVAAAVASAPASPPPVPAAVPEIKQRAQSMVAPQAGAPPAISATIPGKCPWCGAAVSPSSVGIASCPECGAALGVRSAASRSGWQELPPRKDMAKLHFGNSSCQIEGLYVPVAEMNLAPEDSVYFSHHVLLWMDTQVRISAMSMRGAWNRMFAGMPLIMTQAQGPGHIAFSKDEPGELIALPLQPGQAVDVREHIFLAATANVEYDWFQNPIWYRVQAGKDQETIYPVGMYMDRFSAPSAPGLLLLHAGGSVLVRELAAGQEILVKPTALVFKDPSVDMQLHIEQPNAGFLSWGSWTNRAIWLRLVGPGRVAIQSVFERVEQEGGNIINTSYSTFQAW